MKLKTSFSFIYLIYTAAVPLLTSLSAGFWVLWIDKAGPNNFTFLGWLFLWFLAVMVSGLSIMPTSVVALLVGYLGGMSQWPYLIVTYLLATLIGHFLAKKIASPEIMDRLISNPKAKNIVNNINENPAWVVGLARLSPVFPFGVSNVIFTYLGTPLFTLLWAGIVGMLPRSLFLLWIGSQASSIMALFDKTALAQQPIVLVIVGIVSFVFLLYLIFRKQKLTI